MSWIGFAVLVVLAVSVFAAMRLRARRPRKQCPECGAYVDLDSHDCRYCGYVFAPA